jgi:hypothetical protein
VTALGTHRGRVERGQAEAASKLKACSAGRDDPPLHAHPPLFVLYFSTEVKLDFVVLGR